MSRQHQNSSQVWFAAAGLSAAWSWIFPVYGQLDGGEAVGLVLLALAVALIIRGTGIASGLTTAVAMVSIALVADLLLRRLEAAYQPELRIFSWAAEILGSLAGAECGTSGGQLLVDMPQGGFRFAPTVGVTAFRPLVLFWITGAQILAVAPPRRLQAVWLALILVPLGLFGIRYGLCVLAFVGTPEALASTSSPVVTLFWSPWSVLATLLASSAILSTLGLNQSNGENFQPTMPPFSRLALALVAGLCAGAAYGYNDPGTSKAGRILIDDRLSGPWEPAGRLLTRDRYGDFSAYSLGAMVEHLSRRLAVSINGDQRYTLEYLDGFDVLVLKTPQEALGDEEVLAISRWVEGGGGLLAIGDHTDLGGMSTCLNPLLAPLGIRFRFDSTAPVRGAFDLWSEPWLPEHPVSAGLADFGLMTGCSLALSGSAQPVLTLSGSLSQAGDYSRPSHFGMRAPNAASPQGMLVVAAANSVGQGRVLAFADSTVLSSFSYFLESHSDFVLHAITWLNYKNSSARWLNWGWITISALALLVLTRGGPKATECSIIAAGFVLPFLAAWWGAIQLSTVALHLPHPSARPITVGFVVEGGYAWLPPVLGVQPKMPPHGNFQTFVQTSQRLGYETRVVVRDPTSLSGLDVLVLLNPDADVEQGDVSHEWIVAVRAWVAAGGALVVIAPGQHHSHPHCRDWLYTGDLIFQSVESPAAEIGLSLAMHGKGRVVHAVGSEHFDVSAMGHCMEYPGRQQKERYESAYALFSELIGVPPLERRTYQP